MGNYLQTLSKYRDHIIAIYLARITIDAVLIVGSAWNGEFIWFERDFWGLILLFTGLYAMANIFYEEKDFS